MKKTVGKVLELYLTYPGDTQRSKATQITLNDGGVENDKFNSKELNRSVLLTALQSYEKAASEGINLDEGALGENILMDYNPTDLEDGTQLQIGDAVVAITQLCTVCKGLTQINNKLPKLLKKDRGIFCKVVKEGNIKKGDLVYLL